MNRISLGEFMKGAGFEFVTLVRANKTKGYLYVVMSKGSGDSYSSEAFYFGKDTAADFKVGDNIESQLGELFAVWVEYTDGREARMKISNKDGNGEATMESRGFVKIDLSAFTGKSFTKTNVRVSVPVVTKTAFEVAQAKVLAAKAKNPDVSIQKLESFMLELSVEEKELLMAEATA